MSVMSEGYFVFIVKFIIYLFYKCLCYRTFPESVSFVILSFDIFILTKYVLSTAHAHNRSRDLS